MKKRILRPDFIHQVMRKEQLGISEFVLLTGSRLGLSVTDPTLTTETGWADDDAPYRYRSQLMGYSGWAKSNRLFCLKCTFEIEGITREIVIGNKCPSCGVAFFDPNDTEKLDAWGFELYRCNVVRYTAISVRNFRRLIRQTEGELAGRGVAPGFNVDHIHSIRHGFELGISSEVISCPPNLQVLRASHNFSKGSRSDLTQEELLRIYAEFVERNPSWQEMLLQSDEDDRKLSEPKSLSE